MTNQINNTDYTRLMSHLNLKDKRIVEVERFMHKIKMIDELESELKKSYDDKEKIEHRITSLQSQLENVKQTKNKMFDNIEALEDSQRFNRLFKLFESVAFGFQYSCDAETEVEEFLYTTYVKDLTLQFYFSSKVDSRIFMTISKDDSVIDAGELTEVELIELLNKLPRI